MAPDPRAFPATSRKRALVGATGLLAMGALDIVSQAYSAATAAPRSALPISRPVEAASPATVKA
ncbi:hypothetical protein U1872_03885 [Sphingomonas sp. RB3P16]|uniref:hypothetical protein n=1 Tax=Parasphingomonas frigoris TaxID=3096163 RepID=UPI002FCBD4A2